MAKTKISSVGIEFDALSVRAARLDMIQMGSKTRVVVQGLNEISGDFSTDEQLSKGIKKVKEKIAIGSGDRVNTCLSGKQVWVAQIPFRKLSDEEMKSALRLEIKKNLPFEVAGTAIDYQYIERKDKKNNEGPQVLVTAVANVLLSRHLHMLERLGIKPRVVDVFPCAIANAFHLSQQSFAIGLAYVVIHIGPTVTNLIVTGDEAIPFFHRSIHFNADELFGALVQEEPPLETEVKKRIVDLTEEIGRSISFYEKNYSLSNFAGIFLLGEFLENSIITESIGAKTGLPIEIVDVFPSVNQKSNAPKGKFELAVSLAMRNS